MNDQIKQIAERLRGLRDVLELTSEDIARDSDISAEEYRLAETGEYDISVSMLQKIARTYNVALDALMFGEEPKILATLEKEYGFRLDDCQWMITETYLERKYGF